ncbi:MAG: glycosyltransferase family 1 protein [Verrucomicrobiales bacterium]|nr:glycosyltransferase family 1 protein [Verrucomicrobiales bacterium]
MRLLLVSDTYAPDVNGVARTLATLVAALRSRGHGVMVVTTGDEANAFCVDHRTVPSVPLPGYRGLRVGLASRGRLEELIRECQADVLYVATETPLGLAAIRAADRLRVPVISGFHTNFQTYLEDYHLPGLETVARRVLTTMHNQTVRTLTPSHDSADLLRDWGVDNVGVLGRGVDTALFDPARRCEVLRASWGAGPETPVTLYVGRMAAEKNLPLAARAFRRVRRLRPDAIGVFVGDGPRWKAMQQEYPEFVYAGARHGEDLARHYASGDLFVFPSSTETFGNVVLEACASGLPVVGFDYAAPRLLVRPGRNGWLAPLENETAFLQACERWATAEDHAEMRATARAVASAHSWSAVISQFEEELLAAAGVTLAQAA